MKTNRRSAFKKFLLGFAGLAGFGAAKAAVGESNEKEVAGIVYDQDIPLFSSVTTHGDLVYLAGKGAHFEDDITAHTKKVLDDMEQELIKAGSSMQKVLKVNVYLADLKDYQAMNDVYRGRFGSNPPVRTTIAAAGVPGNSLVEIDCIAYK